MYTWVQIDKVFSITSMYTAFKMTFQNNYSFSGEFHNFWEIVFVLEGKLGITAGSSIHILKKGQAILHPPMEFHNLWSEGGTSPTVVIFSFSAENMPETPSRFFQFDNFHKPIELLNNLKAAFVMEYNVNFVDIKDKKGFFHQSVIKELELFLLSLLNNGTSTGDVPGTASASHFSKAVSILEKNIDKNLSVKDISRLCNIGEVTLKKTFSRYSGIGVMAYFTKMKVTAAIQMLKSGMNVSETAYALGFSNQNYFSTVFKRITGHPPAYYK